MSELFIYITIKVDGVLTDADAAPTLTDETSAYGVRRGDTLAVIAAAGTAMTRTSAGQYRYEIPSPVAGVIYEYAILALVDGETLRDIGTVSLTSEDLPSYLTAADATALAGQLPGLSSFKAATDAEKLAALCVATSRFDTARRYQGSKYELDQVLEFPRSPYGSPGVPPRLSSGERSYGYADQVWDWDWDNNVAIVPRNVKLAVLHEANSIIAGVRDAKLDARHDGLLSQSVGGMSESYAQISATDNNGNPVLCRDADRLSRMYALRSGKLL